MSRGAGALMIAAVAGGAWYLWRRDQSAAQAEPVIMPAVQQDTSFDNRSLLSWGLDTGLGLIQARVDRDQQPQAPRSSSSGLLSALLGGFGVTTGTGAGTGTGSIRTPTPSPGGGQGYPTSLMSLIRSAESGNDYNRVWSGIPRSAYPSRPITSMTVREVYAWQGTLNTFSTASGAYQFIRATLWRTAGQAGVRDARFDRATQDAMAMILLEEAGLSRYRAGQITDVKFAQELSRIWAGLPAQTVDRRGRTAQGQSYYEDDGVNRASVSRDRVLSAVRSA